MESKDPKRNSIEGLAAIRDALLASVDPQEEQWEGSLSEDVVSFAKLVLEGNNFEFDREHFIQKLGTAIGTRMAPSYANIFMDKLERRLIREAQYKPHTW